VDDESEMRIGQIAERTGLTVRTLRYYEQLGLIGPTRRTPAGHRLYAPDDVERLYQVALLRSLELPLGDVSRTLASTTTDLQVLMTEHLARVDQRLEGEQRLRSRLAEVISRLESPEDTTGALLGVLKEMTMSHPLIARRVSILVYDDIEAAFEHLVGVFGLVPGELTRDERGQVVHAAVRAGDGEVWLHPESSQFGLASPIHLGGASATMAVMVDDVDAHHRHAVDKGATIRYDPVDQPYGYREYGAVDQEGHLWSFMKVLG
jgi:DNA-binding transcriptional MerR regulator